MRNVSIKIESRYPKTKQEKNVYGLSITEKDSAKIFINGRRTNREFANTFFHEMVHVFLCMYYPDNKLNRKENERLAQQIGNAVAGILKGF